MIGCAARPTPCAGPTCPAVGECLANRCVPKGTEPVDPASTRLVLRPKRIAVVTRETAPGLPMTVTLGDAARGPVTLLLDFGDSWKDVADVDAAFLLLEPTPKTGVSDDIEVHVWRINDPWDEARVRWATQPALGIPGTRGIARFSPPTDLRVDVTPLIRFLRDETVDHGLALVAKTNAAGGATYWTGVGGGRGPRLELYVRECEAGAPDDCRRP